MYAHTQTEVSLPWLRSLPLPSLSCTEKLRCAAQAFDPNAGLFAETDDKKLYPHPQALQMVPHAVQLFNFLGRMIGKVRWPTRFVLASCLGKQ